jgi:flagellar basal body-associated protein FliL
MRMHKPMRARYGTRATAGAEVNFHTEGRALPGKQSSRRRPWVVSVVILWIALVIGGAGAMKLALLPQQWYGGLADDRRGDLGIGPMVHMDKPVRVNLTSGPGKQRSAVVQVALEVKDRDNVIVVGQQMPVFKNAIVQILGAYTVAECLSAEGQVRIKAQILTVLPDALADRVVNLYFLKLIIT